MTLFVVAQTAAELASEFKPARLHFGFGNPNMAAAFLAILWCLMWCAAAAHKKLIPLSFLTASVVAWLIVGTASRGGLIAVLAGSLCLLWHWRGQRQRVLWVIAAVVLLLIMLAFSRMGERIALIPQDDPSMNARMLVYRSIPAMMHAAPYGWGTGQSAQAYHNWFQSSESMIVFRHLLSTHGVMLVETGWVGRYTYVLGIILVLNFVFFPFRQYQIVLVPIAAANCAAFIAATVNHIADNLMVQFIWGGCLLVLLILRGISFVAHLRLRSAVFLHHSKMLPWLLGVFVLPAVLLGIACILGFLQNNVIEISRSWNEVVSCRNRNLPEGMEVHLYSPLRAVVGEDYGKEIRRAMRNNSFIAKAQVHPVGASAPDHGFALLIIAGDSIPPDAEWFDNAAHVIWLNPSIHAKAAIDQTPSAEHTILWGARNTQPHGLYLRESFPKHFHLLPADTIYVENFFQKVLDAIHRDN